MNNEIGILSQSYAHYTGTQTLKSALNVQGSITKPINIYYILSDTDFNVNRALHDIFA